MINPAYLRLALLLNAVFVTFYFMSQVSEFWKGQQEGIRSVRGVSTKPRFEDYGKERLGDYLEACLQSNSIPEVIWTFWFGDVDMSENRRKAFLTIEQRLKVPLILITERNITDYTRWGVNQNVQYLSGIHKADYFRIYFMLHYGGGYTDIKHMGDSWKPYFKTFDDPNVWMVGAPEIRGGVAWGPDRGPYPGDDYHNKMISNCFMVARPNNPFLQEVHQLQHEELDKMSEALKAHPPPIPGLGGVIRAIWLGIRD